MTITIDGPAGSGKSTAARRLARQLGIAYLDTGAMYRAITLKLTSHSIEPSHMTEIGKVLNDTAIDITYANSTQQTLLDGQDVSQEIRAAEVSRRVSDYAALEPIRTYLVKQQRQMANQRDFVVDGRDAGSVVFPQAEVKFYLTASIEERARRRRAELLKLNPDMTQEQMIEEIRKRDHIDSTRKISPLIKPKDAIEIDNTEMDLETQIKKMQAMINRKAAGTA